MIGGARACDLENVGGVGSVISVSGVGSVGSAGVIGSVGRTYCISSADSVGNKRSVVAQVRLVMRVMLAVRVVGVLILGWVAHVVRVV